MSCSDVDGAGAAALARRAGVCLIVIAAVFLPQQDGIRAADGRADIRAVSIPAAALDPALDPGDASRRLVAAAMQDGFNTVLIPVALDGVDGPAATQLDALIAYAHERGVRVHAAVPVTTAARAGALPSPRDHVIYRHPEWLMVPRELALDMRDLDPRYPDYIGKLARWTRAHSDRANGLYLSPLQPDAAAYIADAVRRIVSRYAVDGIHLEGLGFPGPDFDYSERSLEAFRSTMRRTLPAVERARLDEVEAIDPFGYSEELPDEWRRFRTTSLTSLVARLGTVIRAERPAAVVSAEVVQGAEFALSAHLQDWRTWVDNQFVDALGGRAARATTLVFSYETLVDPAPTRASTAGTAAAGPP